MSISIIFIEYLKYLIKMKNMRLIEYKYTIIDIYNDIDS